MKRDRIYRVPCILVVAILLATVSVAHASTYYWIDASADWTASADWSNGSTTGFTPASGDTVYIGNSGTVAVSGTDACTNLYVGSDQSTGAVAGTLNIGANFHGNQRVHRRREQRGTVTQTAGAATITTLSFGGATSGWAGGTYNLNGGTLTSGSITQGTYGAGTFNLGGGWVRFTNNSPTTTSQCATLNLNSGTISSGSSTSRSLYNPFSLGGNVTCGSATTYTGSLLFYSAGTLTNNVTLTANKSTAFYGAIGDGGHGYGITTAGAATVTFNGQNTWTGPLSIGSGSTAYFGRTDSYSMSNVTGAGNLTLNSGTLTLSGTDTVGGSTTVNSSSALTTLSVTRLWAPVHSSSGPPTRVRATLPFYRRPDLLPSTIAKFIWGRAVPPPRAWGTSFK